MSAMRSASSSTTKSNVAEIDVTALDQVLEPAGAGHEHVDPPSQGRQLLRRSRHRRTPGRPGTPSRERVRSLGGDLLGELAGRRQDEADGTADGVDRREFGGVGDHGHPECDASCPTRSAHGRSTSRPARPSAMVAAWISKGWVMPRRASASQMNSGTPRSANEDVVTDMMSLSGSRGSRARVRGVRGFSGSR